VFFGNGLWRQYLWWSNCGNSCGRQQLLVDHYYHRCPVAACGSFNSAAIAIAKKMDKA
jgi:hypothetical protein